MRRFGVFADLADQNGLKLMVGLVTGWMSGRLFVPPAVEGLNILTDPRAILWQVRFVRHFVGGFRDHPAVLAWDLGNECNCLGDAGSRENAWLWTASIANAIRSADPTRPIVSGMHSLAAQAADGRHWAIQDQGELTDVLTTHPYPVFTPHCDQDPLSTIRSCLHAAAETRLYADLGARPCMAEEVGTLGPMFCSEQIGADYLRTVLFSLWAHDCHGLLWWCGFDQQHLTHAPYDWAAVERELGLFRPDRSPKPVLEVLSRFGRFVRDLPTAALPPRRTEAVCILTAWQDQWAAAYSSFVLATQAGFDLTFRYAGQPLPDAELYLMPSVRGWTSFTQRFWRDLLDRVRGGATLYLSGSECLVYEFEETFGLQAETRHRRTGPAQIVLDGLPGQPALSANAAFKFTLSPTRAEVLGREADGNPAFTRADCGKGTAYFLSWAIEQDLAETPQVFDADGAVPFWRIYHRVAEPLLAGRVVRKAHPLVGVTEHPLAEDRRVVVLVNYSPRPQSVPLTLADGWSAAETWYGQAPAAAACAVAANDAAVFVVSR